MNPLVLAGLLLVGAGALKSLSGDKPKRRPLSERAREASDDKPPPAEKPVEKPPDPPPDSGAAGGTTP